MLASRVRLKLTRNAANPKLPLRLLVLQANMLDNLMDHISSQYETRKSESKTVSFAVDESPKKRNVSVLRGRGPTVTEYEVESDSDLDLDSDSELDLGFSDSDSDYDSDEEEEEDEDADDYYYHTTSDVDVVEEIDADVILSSSALSSSRANYKPYQVQSVPRSQPRVQGLLVIMEDQNEDGLPGLTRLTSNSSDEEDEEENSFLTSAATIPASYKITSEDLLRKNGLRDIEVPARHHHQRHDSVYSIEAVF